MTIVERIGALLLAVVVSVSFPLLIWVGIGGALWQMATAERPQRAPTRLDEFSCAIDADCPPGFVCIGGRCVAQAA